VKRAEAEQGLTQKQKPTDRKEGDDINWFGVKVGTGNSAFGSDSVGGAVGKYLDLKRPLETAGSGGDAKKKKKTGFGEFDGW
jgi:peptidyl-prolyl cis-trans isomerase-like protein 2